MASLLLIILLFLGASGITAAYFFLAWLATRQKVPVIEGSVTSPPRDLSPAAMRYIYTGESDAKALLSTIIHADKIGMYKVLPLKDDEGYAAKLVEKGAAFLLAKEEKAALTANKNYFWKTVRMSKATNQLRKMERRLRAVLNHNYGRFLKKNKALGIFGGILAALSLSCASLLFDGVFFEKTILGGIFFLGFVVLPGWAVKTALKYGYSKAFLLTLIPIILMLIPVMMEGGFADMGIVLAGVLAQTFIVSKGMSVLKTHSKTGTQVKAEIEAFREFLSEVANPQNAEVKREKLPDWEQYFEAYALALDIDPEWSDQLISKMTTQETDPQGSFGKRMESSGVFHYGPP